MKKSKRWLSLLLALVLAFGTISLINVDAADYVYTTTAQINDHFNDLVAMANAGRYFTTGDGTQPCWQNSHGTCNSSTPNCTVTQVCRQNWLWNFTDYLADSANLFPKQYYPSGNSDVCGNSCFGFACYAMWYIFSVAHNNNMIGSLSATSTFTANNIKSLVDSGKLKKGYILRFSRGHSVIFDKIDPNGQGIYVLDCNMNHASVGNSKIQHYVFYYSNYYSGDSFAVTKPDNVIINDSASGTPITSFDRSKDIITAYSESVTAGKIRYVAQMSSDGSKCAYYQSGYWENDNGKQGCLAASTSMVLSYLGINMTPKTMKAYGLITHNASAGSYNNVATSSKIASTASSYSGIAIDSVYTGSLISDIKVLDVAINNFLNSNGAYSPPIVWSGTNGSHYYLVVGKNSDGTYSIIDPVSLDHYKTVKFQSGASIGYSWDGTSVRPMNDVVQYKLRNGVSLVSVSSVSLSADTLTMRKGEKATLTATVAPSNASNKSVSWSSSDSSVVSVSGGALTALKAGTATITVTTVDGNKKAECLVTVNPVTYTVHFDAPDAVSGVPGDLLKNEDEDLYIPDTTPIWPGSCFVAWRHEGVSVAGEWTTTKPDGEYETAYRYSVYGLENDNDYTWYYSNYGGGTATKFASDAKSKYSQIYSDAKIRFFWIIDTVDHGAIWTVNNLTANYRSLTNAAGSCNIKNTKFYREVVYRQSVTPTIELQPGDAYTANESIVFEAVWEARSNQWVSFDAAGGTGAPETIEKKYNETIRIPATIPTRNNYAFICWRGDDGNAYHPGDLYSVNENLALAAEWESTTVEVERIDCVVNATYHIGDAFLLDYSVYPQNADNKSVTFFSDAPEIASVSQNGYVTVNGVGDAHIYLTAANGIAKTLTIHSEYRNYTLSFDIDGFDDITVAETEYADIPSEIPTKTDYVFGCWHCEELDYDFNPGDSIQPAQNLSFIAVWYPAEDTLSEVRVLPLTMTEYKNGFEIEEYDDELNVSLGKYFRYSVYPRITLVFASGREIETSYDAILNHYSDYIVQDEATIATGQSVLAPWGVGDHKITVTVDGVTGEGIVTIEQLPLASIELLPGNMRTEYYVGEYLDFSGSTLRFRYTDNTYEDVLIWDLSAATVNGTEMVYLNKLGYCEIETGLRGMFTEAGTLTACLSCLGRTVEKVVTVNETQILSTVIRNEDHALHILLTDSNGVETDCTVIGREELLPCVYTDKGIINGDFFINTDGKLQFRMVTGVNILESNALNSSDWWDMYVLWEEAIHPIKWASYFCDSEGYAYTDIDESGKMTYMATFAANLLYCREEDPASINMPGDDVRAVIKTYFGVDNADLSLSEYYNAGEDTFPCRRLIGDTPDSWRTYLIFDGQVWRGLYKYGDATNAVFDTNGRILYANVGAFIDPQLQKAVALFESSKSMTVGEKSFLSVSVQEKDSILWRSSDSSVVAVDRYGRVIAQKIGSAVITAYNENGDMASCLITVDVGYHTVSYSVEGGTAPASVQKADGTGIVLAAAPVRDGFTFLGWATEPGVILPEYQPGDTYTTDKSVVFYAVWRKNVASDEPQIIVGNAKGFVGKQVTVEVTIKNNPGFIDMLVGPNYPEGITLYSVENGTLVNDFTMDYAYLWSANSDVTDDGLLMTLTFDLSGKIVTGDYVVSLSFIEADNYNEEAVEFAVVPGILTISDVMIGDCNDDGKVGITDVTRLKKYLAARRPDGTSSVEINMLAADCTGDGKVGITDVTRLKKYLAARRPDGTSSVILGA